MWTRLLPLDAKEHYTALLGISKASLYDDGLYTCQVMDWGRQQCKSINVKILTAPKLRVMPPSVTLYRGASVRIRCLTPNYHLRDFSRLGYSWTKNGHLFQSNPDLEFWEDLYPDGSVLNLNNVKKSAEYSCIVSNTVAPVSKGVYINVVDKDKIILCPVENSFGVAWPESAPGPPIYTDCPNHSQGQVTRYCEQQDFGKPKWLQPDFSNCVQQQIGKIYSEFQELCYGYQNTNTTTVLQQTLEYVIIKGKQFLPGEAAVLLKLLTEVNGLSDM